MMSFSTTGKHYSFEPYTLYSPADSALYRLSAKTEMLLMLTTFVLSIVWDLEIGIVVSIIISLVLVVRRSSKPRMTILICRAAFEEQIDGNQ
jgi:MFS superfamily sulfate permease-like transporter